jgi:hypothetical protein
VAGSGNDVFLSISPSIVKGITMKYRWSIGIALIALLMSSGGCKKDVPGSELLGQAKGQVPGLTWSVPKTWTVGPAREMRVATYTVDARSGDAEGGECTVFHFGPGVGGDLESNISRWAGQFEQAEGPRSEPLEINGMQVTVVRIAGTYLAPSGPMMASSGKKENFRLLGAIVEGPHGSVFFKLTGPAKTIEAASAEFNAMIHSLSL